MSRSIYFKETTELCPCLVKCCEIHNYVNWTKYFKTSVHNTIFIIITYKYYTVFFFYLFVSSLSHTTLKRPVVFEHSIEYSSGGVHDLTSLNTKFPN